MKVVTSEHSCRHSNGDARTGSTCNESPKSVRGDLSVGGSSDCFWNSTDCNPSTFSWDSQEFPSKTSLPVGPNPIGFPSTVEYRKEEVFQVCGALALAETILNQVGKNVEAAHLASIFDLVEEGLIASPKR